MEDCTKYFLLYKKVISQMNFYKNMRESLHGIAVGNDEYAKKWQGLNMRRELLEAKLEGRNPNWYHAYYLPIEEMERRNKSYNL